MEKAIVPNGNEYLEHCKTFREPAISEQIVFQTIDDLKKALASNNKRRLTYGVAARRGMANANRVKQRREKKRCRKNGRPSVLFMNEESFLFNMLKTARRYQPPAEVFKYPLRASHATPDFSPMPYDFDAEKNALMLVESSYKERKRSQVI